MAEGGAAAPPPSSSAGDDTPDDLISMPEDNISDVPLMLTDAQLASIAVRDLNRLMEQQQLTEEQVSRVKRYRRMLKNREYALSSNRRKDELCSSLEQQRDELRQQAVSQSAQIMAQRKRIEEWQVKIAALESVLAGGSQVQSEFSFSMLPAADAAAADH